MALLSLLCDLRHELGIQVHVAHFNHRLRRDSSHDENFVKDWCQQFNVPLTVGKRKGGALQHLSEDGARQMRFDFLIKTTQSLRAQSVALAHTSNDLAETVLMRVMRGSGLFGLRAIVPSRQIKGVRFIRPLIEIPRAEIEKYLKQKKIPFCTDSTNSQNIYERNKLRLRLLPQLAREYNPQIIKALADLGMTAGDDYEFLEAQAQKQFKKIAHVSQDKVTVQLKDMKRQHTAMQRMILRLMAGQLTHELSALTFEHIHILERLIAQENETTCDLPLKLRARKTRNYLELSYV